MSSIARQSFVCLFLACVVLGCQAADPLMLSTHENGDAAGFGAVRMRLHPIFTQLKNWSDNSSRPDGIQAELEFTDRYGDPCKAQGTVRFELFSFRRDSQNHEGDRIAKWNGSLLTPEEQLARWNRTSGTYTFRLSDPQVSTGHSYVLSATFEPPDGHRFFSQLILERVPPQTVPPYMQIPTTMPTTKPAVPTGGAPSTPPSPPTATPAPLPTTPAPLPSVPSGPEGTR